MIAGVCHLSLKCAQAKKKGKKDRRKGGYRANAKWDYAVVRMASQGQMLLPVLSLSKAWKSCFSCCHVCVYWLYISSVSSTRGDKYAIYYLPYALTSDGCKCQSGVNQASAMPCCSNWGKKLGTGTNFLLEAKTKQRLSKNMWEFFKKALSNRDMKHNYVKTSKLLGNTNKTMILCMLGSQAMKFGHQIKLPGVYLYFKISPRLHQLTFPFRLKLLKVLQKTD